MSTFQLYRQLKAEAVVPMCAVSVNIGGTNPR
jgi:hypothetical protein